MSCHAFRHKRAKDSDNWQTGRPQRIARGGWKCGWRGRSGEEQSRKERKRENKAVWKKKRKVVTSKALRRSRRGLVLSLSSSAWLASGSAFGGGPVSGSVWVAGREPFSSGPSCCFCTSSESLSCRTDNETRLEGDRGRERKEKIWQVNTRADGKKALKREVWQMFRGRTEPWKTRIRGKEKARGERRKGRGSDGQTGRPGGSLDNRAPKHPLIPNHVSLVFQRLAVTLRALVSSVSSGSYSISLSLPPLKVSLSLSASYLSHHLCSLVIFFFFFVFLPCEIINY